MTPQSARVSVVVPTYAAGERLAECLRSLRMQSVRPFEIVVADNEGSDEVRALCAAESAAGGAGHDVRHVPFVACRSSYAARNAGAAAAKGDVLLFWDSDQIAFPGMVAQAAAALGAPPRDDVVWAGRLDDDPRVPAELRRWCSISVRAAETPHEHRPSAALALSAALFTRLGGFRSDLLSGGDFEFTERASRVARIVADVRTSGHHHWARTPRDLLLRARRYGFGACLAAKAAGRSPPSVAGAAFWTAVSAVRAAGTFVVRAPRSIVGRTVRTDARGIVLRFRRDLHHALGVADFHRGRERSGDLPPDASVAAASAFARNGGARG